MDKTVSILKLINVYNKQLNLVYLGYGKNGEAKKAKKKKKTRL